MMTFILKSAEVGDHVIELGQEKFESTYFVASYSKYGSTETRLFYPKKEKAIQRFNYLKHKYAKEAVV